MALGKIHLISHPIFPDFDVSHGIRHHLSQGYALPSGNLIVDMDHGPVSSKALVQPGNPIRKTLKNAQTVDLDAEDIAKSVDNKSPQTVTIGMDDPKSVGSRR